MKCFSLLSKLSAVYSQDGESECSRGVLVNQVLLWGLFLHLVSWIAVDRNIISLWHLSGGERERELIYNAYVQDIRITGVVCASGMIPETVRLIEKRYAITFENVWFSPVDNKKTSQSFKEGPFEGATQAISRGQNISSVRTTINISYDYYILGWGRVLFWANTPGPSTKGIMIGVVIL